MVQLEGKRQVIWMLGLATNDEKTPFWSQFKLPLSRCAEGYTIVKSTWKFGLFRFIFNSWLY